MKNPYFHVDGHKVYTMYDPPHLIKSIRNNLRNQGFICQGQKIEWKHIVDFYNFDKELSIRMAPKLTDYHINLRAFAAMRVNLATQVLSHSVAAGICTLAELGKLEKSAIHTAKFVEFFDKLFNTFNSSSIKSHQQYGHAFSGNTGHVGFLNEALEMLENMTLANGRGVPCIEGWKMSITALNMLWNDLHTEHGFKFLLTSRLNQDCIENLFSVVRGKQGSRDNPNPEQFRGTFRQIIVDRLLVKSDYSNCKSDVDKVLLDVSSISANTPSRAQSVNASSPAMKVSISDFTTMSDSIPVANVATYVAGYLLRKVQFTCSFCMSKFIIQNVPTDNIAYTFIDKKAYSGTCGLVYPSEQFAVFVEKLEHVYVNAFPNVMHLDRIMFRLENCAKELVDTVTDCENDMCIKKVHYCITLFFKIRIHASLKRSNSDNSMGKGCKRNRKVLKLMHL